MVLFSIVGTRSDGAHADLVCRTPDAKDIQVMGGDSMRARGTCR